MNPNQGRFYAPLVACTGILLVATGGLLLIQMLATTIGPFQFAEQSAAEAEATLELLQWPGGAAFAATVELDFGERPEPAGKAAVGRAERALRAEMAEAEATGGLARISIPLRPLGESAARALEARTRLALRQRGAWVAEAGKVAAWILARSAIAASARRVGPQRLLIEVANHGARPAPSVALRLHLGQAAAELSLERTTLRQELPDLHFRSGDDRLDLMLPLLPGNSSSAYTLDYHTASAP